MIFICPHCEQHLQIRPQFLGFRGYCKKCGGRIALLGNRNILTAQWARKLEPQSPHTPEPAANGAATPLAPRFESNLEAALEDISGWDDELFSELEEGPGPEAPPTPEQIARLKALGATAGQLARVTTKGAAIRLIEVLQPPPTAEQLDLLRSYGLPEEELTFLTTHGVAQAMIDEYLSDSDSDLGDSDD